MRRYVFAREPKPLGVYYWQCVDPSRPETGTSLTLQDLNGVARSATLSLLWIDARRNSLVVGEAVQPSDLHVRMAEAERLAKKLEALPLYVDFMREWEGNERLRINAFRRWQSATLTKRA